MGFFDKPLVTDAQKRQLAEAAERAKTDSKLAASRAKVDEKAKKSKAKEAGKQQKFIGEFNKYTNSPDLKDPELNNKMIASGLDPSNEQDRNYYFRQQQVSGAGKELGVAEAALDKAIQRAIQSRYSISSGKLKQAIADIKSGKGAFGIKATDFAEHGYYTHAKKQTDALNKTYAAETSAREAARNPAPAPAAPPPEQEQYYINQQGPVGGAISGGQTITGGVSPFAQFIQANRERAGQNIDVAQVGQGRLFDPKGLNAGEAAADRNILGAQGISAKKGLLSQVGWGLGGKVDFQSQAGRGTVKSNQSLKNLFPGITSPYGTNAQQANAPKPGETPDQFSARRKNTQILGVT
jgi:hypothetical protein